MVAHKSFTQQNGFALPTSSPSPDTATSIVTTLTFFPNPPGELQTSEGGFQGLPSAVPAAPGRGGGWGVGWGGGVRGRLLAGLLLLSLSQPVCLFRKKNVLLNWPFLQG